MANKSREGKEPKDSAADPCRCKADGPSPSLVRDASQLILGVRPLPRSKDKRLVFEGVSSMGAPSPMSSSGDAIARPDCESHGASRDDALVRGRAGAPRLGPARAARSSREPFSI